MTHVADAAQAPDEPSRAATWWHRAERTLDSPLGNAVLAGVLGTVPVRRAPRALRRAWTVVPATALAGAMVQHGRTQDPPWRLGPTVAASVGGAVVMAGVQQGGIAVDARLEAFARRRGARHPRVVVGLVHGVLALVLGWASRRVDRLEAARTDDGGAPANGDAAVG